MNQPLLRPAGELVWTQIQPGAEQCVVAGDPEQVGAAYVIRFRTAQEIAVAPHWHPADEHITVLEGRFALGFGDRFDKTALAEYPAGSYLAIPKGVRHFAFYWPGTVLQVNGLGPFQSIEVEEVPD